MRAGLQNKQLSCYTMACTIFVRSIFGAQAAVRRSQSEQRILYARNIRWHLAHMELGDPSKRKEIGSS